MELRISNKKILVVGSLNMDYTFYIDDAPVNDLSYIPKKVIRTAGGHGGNCAVSIARLGGNVGLLSCIGNDENGRFLADDLIRENVNTNHIICKDAPSGTVYIPIFNNNYKYMIMDRGANDYINLNDINIENLCESYSSVILFDIEKEVSLKILEHFNRLNRLTCVILCSASKIDIFDFEKVGYPTYIIVNNEEAKLIPFEKLVAHCNIITTLGAKGLRADLKGKEAFWIDGIYTNTCDTVGAGDCFAGLLNFFLMQEVDIYEALTLANIGAAISTTKAGAREGLPNISHIMENIKLKKLTS